MKNTHLNHSVIAGAGVCATREFEPDEWIVSGFCIKTEPSFPLRVLETTLKNTLAITQAAVRFDIRAVCRWRQPTKTIAKE